MRAAIVLVFAAGVSLPAQDVLPREVLMLSRIRAHVRESIERLPDCTCIESVARFHRAPGKDLQRSDIQTLQVLFSGDKELFALPGATRWETDPFRFMTGGMMGNGIFALHLRTIFLDNVSLIRYRGMESPGARTEARYDFSIPRMLSGYHIHYGNASAVVAQRGSFWADPETYDLRRLEFYAEEVPPDLMYTEVYTSVWYERVRMGGADVLLPQTAELRTVVMGGEESRDLIEFTHCQAFHAESTLNFADEGTASAPVKPAAERVLPADLRITLELTGRLDEGSAVGSPLEAAVAADVVHKGKVLVPAGAPVRGRIRKLDRHDEDGGYFAVTVEFDRVETSGANLRFYAELQDVDRSSGAEMALNARRRARVSADGPPGVGSFLVHGTRFLLPPGFKTVWKTQPYP